MNERWTLSRGVLEDGLEAQVFANAAYSLSSWERTGRDTLLVLNFPGTYMMQAQERRDAVLEQLEPFLAKNEGVHVAGIARFGYSYTFLFYLGKRPDRGEVPIPAECSHIAQVWLAYDPRWMEYLSYVPEQPALFERIAQLWKSIFTSSKSGGAEILSEGDSTSDESALRALTEGGSDLTRRTDIVFYLYVPTREKAEECCASLWERGYRAHVSRPLGALPNGTVESRFGVISHLEAVPSITTITAAREFMTTLAQQHLGEYDGWEAAIVPAHFGYVYVNEDGTARELSSEERDYLSQVFHPNDGARPYIKGSYKARTPGGSLSGFLARKKLPRSAAV